MAGCVDGIIILPFFATKSTKNIVFVSDFIIFFIIFRSEREIRLRPVVIPPGSGRSFIHTGAIYLKSATIIQYTIKGRFMNR